MPTTGLRTHALCLTRAEVIFALVLLTVGVGVSTVHEALFGRGAQGVFSTAIDATQGGLFWGVILISLWRMWLFLYRALLRGNRSSGSQV